jgi:hypothetical protein
LTGSELNKPSEFRNGIIRVINLKSEHHIVVEPNPTVLFDNDHCCRLHTPTVTTGGLTCLEGGLEAK